LCNLAAKLSNPKYYVIIRLVLHPKDKSNIIGKHAVHEKDTGSPEVQVALFTEEIEKLTRHLKKHQKDNSSRTGLLKMVSKRKKLLDYLEKDSPDRYKKLVKDLGLKR
jgi:small subunit ribosomal protein S15